MKVQLVRGRGKPPRNPHCGPRKTEASNLDYPKKLSVEKREPVTRVDDGGMVATGVGGENTPSNPPSAHVCKESLTLPGCGCSLRS